MSGTHPAPPVAGGRGSARGSPPRFSSSGSSHRPRPAKTPPGRETWRAPCKQRESKGEGSRPRNARAPLRLTALCAHRPPEKFAVDPGIDHSDRVTPTPRGRARGSAAAWCPTEGISQSELRRACLMKPPRAGRQRKDAASRGRVYGQTPETDRHTAARSAATRRRGVVTPPRERSRMLLA